MTLPVLPEDSEWMTSFRLILLPDLTKWPLLHSKVFCHQPYGAMARNKSYVVIGARHNYFTKQAFLIPASETSLSVPYTVKSKLSQ